MHVGIYARMHTYIFLFACVFIQCRMQLRIQWNASVHVCKCYKLFRTPEPYRSPTSISFYKERYDWSIFLGLFQAPLWGSTSVSIGGLFKTPLNCWRDESSSLWFCLPLQAGHHLHFLRIPTSRTYLCVCAATDTNRVASFWLFTTLDILWN